MKLCDIEMLLAFPEVLHFGYAAECRKEAR